MRHFNYLAENVRSAIEQSAFPNSPYWNELQRLPHDQYYMQSYAINQLDILLDAIQQHIKKKNTLCRYFQNGECWYGDHCWYKHSKSKHHNHNHNHSHKRKSKSDSNSNSKSKCKCKYKHNINVNIQIHINIDIENVDYQQHPQHHLYQQHQLLMILTMMVMVV